MWVCSVKRKIKGVLCKKDNVAADLTKLRIGGPLGRVGKVAEFQRS